MKREEVKVDGTYWAKVSGGVVPVRITVEKWQGSKHVGWVGVNTQTNRSVRIKSAQRVRAEVTGGTADAESAAAAATTPGAAEGAASPTTDAPAKGGARGGKGGAKGRGSLKAQAAADQENARMRDEREASADGLTASEGAMANSAPAKAEKTPKQPKPAKERNPKKTSALDAAAQVLAEAGTPMKPKEMVALMEAKRLWTSPGGKTPEATLYAAIIREIAAKGKEARFKKTERGTFVANA